MAIDASIYGQVQPTQQPSIADSMQKAITLSNLGLQNQQAQLANQQAQYQMAQTKALRDAYAANMDEQGNVNKAGVLSDLGKAGYGQAAVQLGQQFAAQDKAKAEAQKAQMESLHQQASVAVPVYKTLLGYSDEDAAKAYPVMLHQMAQQGVDIGNLPPSWNGDTRNVIGRAYNVASQYKEQMDNAMTAASTQEKQAQTAKDYAEAEKTKSETYKQNPNILGQTDDPAKLVPGYVPKEHQAKALSEIDAAENTKRMSQNIMDAFDQASKENTALRTGFGLIRTPGSVMALHQALQPTFKDLEGTVRQAAMDNTFRNVTPAPGDTDKTIATKRAALEEYLQSKASAPTARAYGIDLNKFPSTAAYKSAPPKSSGGDSMGGNSAYAASLPKHGDVEDGYVFMGGDPANPKSWMRQK